ncbi:predicted protein [Uncinocarpus reesii 1704]|uniref:SAC3/GANP/THP3 conserved domain-containing protein n=1 Tax=Uncinocarpus reesii (strain UAMH 1704) TaxID=336963 RepID=C4JN00_UNCRE|nr:uncharacterized protein UREG_04208 [Uncinocarpus reesii 1704]EEP79362.1 predicted protein [Uncinocarpus reesii 1704]
MSSFAPGPKRGTGAPLARGRIFRGSRPSSRKGNSQQNSIVWQHKTSLNRSLSENNFQPTTGAGPRKAQSSSILGHAPTTNTSVIDRARDPRRKNEVAASSQWQANNKTQDYISRFEQLKRERTKQRAKAIDEGLMADPNQPTSLNRAITPTGTCTDMCPQYERVERIVQKMVDKSEKSMNPDTGELEVMETKMIKRFRRSAAGYDEQLPSDIRTPNTLLQTLNYMLRYVITDDDGLGSIHKFVWDRTRSIRNDLSIQQLTQQQDVEIAVKCLERIARFHILALHLLSNPANTEQFDHHQEREQLNNTLLSLLYYYDDNRGRVNFPNEDEFRAYYILFSIHDQRPDLEARVQKWPRELRRSPRIQVALELFAAAGNTWEYQGTLDARRPNAIAQGFYSRFFSLVRSKSVSYLMACIAEIYFNQVRQTAIRSIWKGYCRQPLSQQHKNQEWTVDKLTEVLWFDNEDQTIKFCEDQSLELSSGAEGQLYLDWGNRSIDYIAFQPSSEQIFSEYLVETKRYGRTLPAIILGMTVSQALRHGMIDKSLLRPESGFAALSNKATNEQESLFVSDDENEAGIQNGQAPMAGAGIEKEMPSTSASIFSRPLENVQITTNPFLKHLGGPLPPSSPPSQPFSASAPEFVPQGFSNLTNSQPLPSAPSFAASIGPPSFGAFGSNFGIPSSAAGMKSGPRISQPTSTSIQTFGAPSAPETISFGKPSASQALGAGVNWKNPFSAPFPGSLASGIATQTEAIKDASIIQDAQRPSVTLSQDASNHPFMVDTTGTSNFGNASRPSKPPFPSFSAATFGYQSNQSGKYQAGYHHKMILNMSQANIIKGKSTVFENNPRPFSKGHFQNDAATQANPTFASPQFSKAPELKKTPEVPSSAVFSTLPTKSSAAGTLFTGFQASKSVESEAPEPTLPGTSSFSAPTGQEKNPAVLDQTTQLPTLQSLNQPIDDQNHAEDIKQQALKEQQAREESENRAQEEAAKKEAAKREFKRLQAAQKEKEKKEAAERETAQRLKAMKEQEEELRAARREIERMKANEQKTAEKEAARKSAIEKEIAKRKALSEANEEESRGKSKIARLNPRQTLTVDELLALELSKQKAAPPKPCPQQKSLIDEDELLFSAARMAGRELSRIGLFDSVPQFRESVSRPSTPSSFSSSVLERVNNFSRSTGSDRLHATVNGYKVALAPETPLGLGRTLSRTEQRIRQTGAKGLAYKPIANILNTPDEKGKSISSKRKTRS